MKIDQFAVEGSIAIYAEDHSPGAEVLDFAVAEQHRGVMTRVTVGQAFAVGSQHAVKERSELGDGSVAANMLIYFGHYAVDVISVVGVDP